MKTKKILALALAAVLLVAVGVGGTLAWLADTTDAVENTFTAAGIDISLEETKNYDTNNDGTNDSWQMQMIPGTSANKDPKVTVEDATTVDIILFVEFTQNVTDLTYTSTLKAPDWTNIENTNVWYRLVSAADVAKEFACTESGCQDKDLHWHMLAGDKVEVKNTVTENNNGGTMKWQAWAIQQTGFVGEDGKVTNVANALQLAKANGVVSTAD